MVVSIAWSIVSQWQQLDFSSSSCLLSFWSRNSCSVAVPGQVMHGAFVALRVANDLLDQVFVSQVQSIVSTGNTTFWWALQTQTDWVIFESARTFGSQGTELWEPDIYIWVKAVYNSCKLQRLASCKFFLCMYSFTHTNIVFLFRHLPTEIVIFINVCYFSFLGAGFANIPVTDLGDVQGTHAPPKFWAAKLFFCNFY